MSDDIRSILQRLSLVEGKTVPVSPKGSMTAQQERVPQLPALFKPKSASPVLGAKKDPKHPMDGYMVGGESKEPAKNALEEAMQEVEEDMLSKVKRDLNNYLDRLSDKVDDDGRREKETPELDKLTHKERLYRDLLAKAVDAVDQAQPEEDKQPTSVPVECVTMEDGTNLEIHGDHNNGFEIRRQGRALPTRFPHLDHAKMAIDIFKNRPRPVAQLARDIEQTQDLDLEPLNHDYIEEK